MLTDYHEPCPACDSHDIELLIIGRQPYWSCVSCGHEWRNENDPEEADLEGTYPLDAVAPGELANFRDAVRERNRLEAS